jgi:uncharacterized protein YheU (UPF0270 family)
MASGASCERTCRGVVEALVLREGTDYGEREVGVRKD